MTLDPDEKELLESFERGEWKSVGADKSARMRELACNHLHADIRAGSAALGRGEGRSFDAESGRRSAEKIKERGRARRSQKP